MEIEIVSQILAALWITGVVISATCLLIQIFLYVVLPSSRKMDQKILTHLTVARLISTVFEYGSIYESDNIVQTSVLILVYFHSDAAVVCWMSVFTKRLYDRLVVVFAEDMNFVSVSVTVWLLTLPAGIISSALMCVDTHYIFKFCAIYCMIKCVILSFNMLFFCRIIRVVITARADRNFKSTVKACINSFLLLSVTSLQVLIRFFYTNKTPFFVPTQDTNRNSFLILFSVISCYQVMAITLIFVMILKASNKSEQTLLQKIACKLQNCCYCV